MAAALRELLRKGQCWDGVISSTQQPLCKISTDPDFGDVSSDRMKEGTDLIYETKSILRVASQSLNADLLPVQFRFVYISKPPGCERLSSIRDPLAWNVVRGWEDFTVAACTL